MKKLICILSVMLMSTNVYADTYIRVYNSTTGQYYTLGGSTANNGYSVYKNSIRQKNYEKPAPVQSKPTVPAASAQAGSTEISQQILSLVNAQRTANGLSPLTLNAGLSHVAQAKAEDMKNKNYFSHNSPTYGSPFDMMKSFGISYRTAGENIAKGQKTPQAVMTAWMNSSGHKKNILSPNYTQLGVGYVYNNGSPYWVQMFIG